MRVRLIFEVANPGGYVPFHHQFLLAQTFRGMMAKGGRLSEFDNKDYHFSGLKGLTRVSRKGLHFHSSRATVVFSAADPDLVSYMVDSVRKFPEINLGNLMLVPALQEQDAEPQFSSSEKFLCLSPIVPLSPGFQDEATKRFISPDAVEFSDALYESTIARMESSGLFSAGELTEYFRFQIIPDAGYLRRMEETQKKFSRVYPMFDSDVRYEVRGYTFPFTLYADPKVQQFVYRCGLGHAVRKGFGMLDLAGRESAEARREGTEEDVASTRV